MKQGQHGKTQMESLEGIQVQLCLKNSIFPENAKKYEVVSLNHLTP